VLFSAGTHTFSFSALLSLSVGGHHDRTKPFLYPNLPALSLSFPSPPPTDLTTYYFSYHTTRPSFILPPTSASTLRVLSFLIFLLLCVPVVCACACALCQSSFAVGLSIAIDLFRKGDQYLPVASPKNHTSHCLFPTTFPHLSNTAPPRGTSSSLSPPDK
jgi:hypothetical protein